MRPLALSLLVLLTACGGSKGDSFDVTFKGHNAQNAPVDLHVKADSDGVAHGLNSFSSDDNRDVAPQFILAGQVDGTSSVSGDHCLTSPCPPKGAFTVYSPPPLVYAGPWKGTQAQVVFTNETGDTFGGFDFTQGNSAFVMNFAPPDYHDSGDNVMTQNGTISGAYDFGGEVVAVAGSFTLENVCTVQQAQDYRTCGNARGEDGKSNPVKRPYTENTCPAELVTPFETSPKWTGNTLHLGDIAIDCRVTDGQHTDNPTEQLICYRHATMKAAGCDWDVHFATDGDVQGFAVAAFAKSGCSAAVKTCNTYR